MRLKQTIDKPIHGYWDGGKKQVFYWEIDGAPQHDNRGKFVRVGSYEANHWFHVALGKTEKQTLSYAKKRLQTLIDNGKHTCIFEYVN